MLAPAKHRFNVKEYYRMAETGVLRPDARVELLDGQIMDMSDRWLVLSQHPVRLDEHSEPQPDVLLLRPIQDDYTNRLPRPDDVYLLVEVSDSTLSLDREEKLPLYGRAGIVEVWIVNLVDQTVEVYREPYFTGYGSKTILRAGDKAQPQGFPDVAVDVAELLKR